MIVQRLRGLVNLHGAAVVVLATLLLLAYQNMVHYLPWLSVEISVNLTPYVLCVVGGMLISMRYLHHMATRFHQLTWVDAARLATQQVALMALLVFSFMFAFKDRAMSRLFMGSYLVLAWGMLLFVNQGLPRFLSRLFFEQGRRIPTLFLGDRSSLEKLRGWLNSKEMLGLQPVGFLSDDESNDGVSIPPFLGPTTALRQAIERERAAQLVLLEIPRTRVEAQFIIETCENTGCRLLIYSNLAEMMRRPLATITEEGHQFYTLQDEPLEDPLNRVFKRAFDVLVSLPMVLLVVPILGLGVWIMQRLQAPGALFFGQERTGYGQRPFRLLKFRSMYEGNGKNGPVDEAQQARRGDERIFPFGAFIRRTSIDEFPQFINVLKGEMSVVGPRPHLVAHDHEFSRVMRAYRTRFFVKPGITGLAQCNGFRGEILDPEALEKRIEFDLRYVTHWSIWLDVQITLKTAWQIFFPPRSAY